MFVILYNSSVDIFSPKHLSDRFTQMYEKEWKSAYLESSSKDEVVKQLYNILTVCILLSNINNPV